MTGLCRIELPNLTSRQEIRYLLLQRNAAEQRCQALQVFSLGKRGSRYPEKEKNSIYLLKKPEVIFTLNV